MEDKEIDFKFSALHSIKVWNFNLEEERNWIIQKLQSWYFDIRGLIEKNLAIDKSTLQQ